MIGKEHNFFFGKSIKDAAVLLFQSLPAFEDFRELNQMFISEINPLLQIIKEKKQGQQECQISQFRPKLLEQNRKTHSDNNRVFF